MKKIKIGRSDILKIAKEKYKLLEEAPKDRIDYSRWVDFIENHKDYFIWYEDTEDGINIKKNLDKVPDWAKEGVLNSLNKTKVYSTNKIVKHPFDLIVRYFNDDGIIKIDIERKMNKNVAELLLEMAKYVNGKLIINGNKELENIEQLD
jgi:hypothetical protein